MYDNFRILIRANQEIMKLIRKQQQTDINARCADMNAYKIYIYKEMMRKYFKELNIYRLEYYDIDYRDKIIELETEELDKLKSICESKTLNKTTIKERDLLKILTNIIKNVMGMNYITIPPREPTGVRGGKKQKYTNIDSVNSILLLLLIGGQTLSNDSIDDDIRKMTLNVIKLGQDKCNFIVESDEEC